MVKNNQKQMVVQCYHCGNKTLMNVEHEVKQNFGGIIDNKNHDFEYEMREEFRWILLSCPICHFLTLYQIYTNESMEFFDDNQIMQDCDLQIIYPENRMLLNEVPKKVVNAFESALKIKKIDCQTCLMALRRTLELICKDKNAEGKTLRAKIDNLISKNIFPKGLESTYDVIRQYGNEGAHSYIDLTDNQLNELVQILYSIIDYLYIVPKKSVNLKNQLDKIRKEHENEKPNK